MIIKNIGMAANGVVLVHHLLLLLLFTIFHNFQSGNAQFISPPIQTLESCNIDKIYQFGDSYSDTGNIMQACGEFCTRLPYGQNFYNHHPTGRCSNGELIIDYIATAMGLPYINPYKKVDANFTHGVNFAIAGGTALPAHILEAMNISILVANSSLDIQIDWMSMHFNSICHNDTFCLEKELKHALFIIGGIGTNDYTLADVSGKSFEQIKSMVPEVVQTIENAARRIIHDYGMISTSKLVIVPGELPVGCVPFYLAPLIETDDPFAYDDNRCNKYRNEIAVYHNYHLQQAIEELNQEFLNVTIVYGDNYNAFMWILQNAKNLGFDEKSTQKACCGAGGTYNYILSKNCGTPEATVCADPDVRIIWDDVHLTQAGFMNMAKWLLASFAPQLQCSAFDVSRAR